MLGLSLFACAEKNFQTALEHAGSVDRFYQVAGFVLRLQFAGNAMAHRLTLAFEHLAIPPVENPDLTLSIWDSVSTQTPPLVYPNELLFSDYRGEIAGYNCERIYAVRDLHTKALHLYDAQRQKALYWIKDEKMLPWWVSGSPFQLIFHWWMRSKSIQLTHAAVVGFSQGGILLAGKGGTGKSTTALACMKEGMGCLSEDYCLLSDLPEAMAYNIYCSAKIEENTLKWFPELRPQISNGQRVSSEKALFFHPSEKLLLKCPLKALVSLQIASSEKSWLEPIDAAAIIAPLTIATMWQLTHTGAPVFNHLKRLASALPCYQLHLGSDLSQIPRFIGSLL